MTDSGIAIMGAAKASGEDRAKRVIAEALNSPLLNKSDILGASDILLNITSGTDEITMDEMSEITNYVIKEVGDNAAIIWGVGTDEALEDAISVTVIATGFPMEDVENTFTKPLKGVASVNDVSEEAVDAARTKKIKDGVKDYVQVILKESEVVLQPDLSPEKVEELATTPAYTRRHLKIDRP
jgi:cell division protein FtsZ